tara:strand:- start:11591 stop:11764 length:174 start_codon:yes stop_codon:yes gene_type:complete
LGARVDAEAWYFIILAVLKFAKATIINMPTSIEVRPLGFYFTTMFNKKNKDVILNEE